MTLHKALLISTNSHFLEEFLSRLRQYYDIQLASSHEMALFLYKEWEPHLCIVDLNSPLYAHTAELYQIQKSQGRHCGFLAISFDAPNIFLEEKCFRFGCDQILYSPQDWRQITLRLHALHRRLGQTITPQQSTTTVTHLPTHRDSHSLYGLTIYPNEFLIKRGEEIIVTSPTQFRLFMAFVNHSDQLLSRQWLKTMVWENSKISMRSIDAQISKLKKILPELDAYLINIYGKGYILSSPQKQAA